MVYRKAQRRRKGISARLVASTNSDGETNPLLRSRRKIARCSRKAGTPATLMNERKATPTVVAQK